MKVFIQKLFLFLLALLILAFWIDYAISDGLKKTAYHAEGEYQVWNAVFSGTACSDWLVYGSSRAWVHINPQQMQDSFGVSVYNLGMDGLNFHMQYLRHKKYVSQCGWPKKILLAIDIYSLDNRIYLYNEEQFLPYMLFDPEIQAYRKKYVDYKLANHYLPLLRYAGRKKEISLAKTALTTGAIPFSTRNNGYAGQERLWTAEVEANFRAQQPQPLIADTSLLTLFEYFLEECKSANTEVILIYTPEYYESQKLCTNRKQVINYFETITHKYNLSFLDYSASSFSFNKSLFYNAMHLNKTGAELFTDSLIQDIKRSKKRPEVSFY